MKLAFGNELQIIYEIGLVHEGPPTGVKGIIEAALKGAAHSFTSQDYGVSLLASPDAWAYWDSSFEEVDRKKDLFRRNDSFGQPELPKLSEHTHSLRVDLGLSVFNHSAIEELREIVDDWKNASGELIFQSLIRAIAELGMPNMISARTALPARVGPAYLVVQKQWQSVVTMQCSFPHRTVLEDENNGCMGIHWELARRAPLGAYDHIADLSTVSFERPWALGGTHV